MEMNVAKVEQQAMTRKQVSLLAMPDSKKHINAKKNSLMTVLKTEL